MSEDTKPAGSKTTEGASVELAKFSKERFRYGMWAVMFGVAALSFGFAVTVFAIPGWNPDKGLALFGAMASPLVAIVTAYFGIQASQQVATKAQDQAADAQQQAGAAHQQAALAEEKASNATAEAARAPQQVLDRLEVPVRTAIANALRAQPPAADEVLGSAGEGITASLVEERTAAAWVEICRDVERRLGG